ncbi:MAG TPA: undecaprenyldiphospho-muramoylpentapeptide beta-N-acetylglucosaminyltransferase [Thermoanaerobaculia bacterium]|nr:undecaprenyldiphospho-muramoylpentapeptide beta-N-acetylglucosaminyltransferase [Thermoanaerobaculia bacterium]
MTGAAPSPATGGFVIAGGGTGGHVFPALALAGEIRRRRPDAPILLVGTRRGLETDLVPRAGWPLEFVRAKGLVGKGARARLEGLLALPLAFLDSRRLLARHVPRTVVGVGGYASGPLVATAWAKRIPTVIHEQNAVPGLTNRLLARVATRVAAGTDEGAARLGGVAVGNPVREDFFAIPSLVSREKARTMRLLAVGGSQGAAILNRVLPGALARAAAAGVSFTAVHQAGKGRAADVEALYEKHGLVARDRVVVREFLNDMPEAFAAADLVVARAGAMTVAEVSAAGRPALLVPFAGATHGHQAANARALEAAGAARVVPEERATEEGLGGAIAALLSDPLSLLAMGEAARRSARPDAAARLCDVVFEAEARA